MAVIASGEIDLKLSAKSQAALENQLSKASNQAGTKAGSQFSSAFGSKLGGLGDKVSKALGGISTGTLVSGVAAAGTAIAAFATSSVTHFLDAAQSVRAFQRVTGQTAKDASHLVSAFDDMDITASAATNAMGKLAVNVGDGGKKLGAFGIEVAKTKTGATDLVGTFDNVRKAVNGTTVSAEQVQIAVAAFGKTGKDLLPILKLNDAAFQELKKHADLNFSQAQLDSAERYRLALDQAEDNVNKLKNAIGSKLVPVISDYLEAANNAADSSKSWGDRIVDLLFGVSDQEAKSKEATTALIQQTAAEQALGVETGTLTGLTKDQVQAFADEKDAIDKLLVATLSGFDASINYQQAKLAERDAIRDVQAKHEAATIAVRDHGAGSIEAVTATDQLTQSLLNQQELAKRSADAMSNLAIQNAGGATAAGAAKAGLDAEIASLQASVTQIRGTGGNVDALNALITHLKDVRGDYKANIDANTGAAEAKIAHLKSAFAGLQASGFFQTGGTARTFANTPPGSVPSSFTNDTISVLPPGRSMVNNQTGGDEVVVNADLIRRGGVGGGTTINVYEVANDPQATAFAVNARLGESSQR